ncbi:cysteine desulfurase [Rothia sp. AR01]|uniref:Cysteine desulfurase n=1 Tax=Rothia santali TaxID=2949643 RepID=A0A9X2HLK6_9MICC|nr:cysteine desulfurase family protein [Rothia santali]MCP3426523.1 cysteine desulfurase [Rothia santali]
MQRVYLDHAATAPVSRAALEATTEQLRRGGNPSSLHSAGRSARSVVEEARERVAAAVGADPAEVIFTSGGTEADNLAIKGMFWSRNAEADRPRVIVSAVEHHAVADPAEWLARRQGARLERLPVDDAGRVDPADLARLLAGGADDVALVSVMWANNEVGTVQPVPELAAIAAAAGVPFHTDAVQSLGAVPLDFRGSGATTMALSGHKIGAPMGVGVLVATRTAPLEALIHGGGQEREVRSGTIDAPAIAGFGAAIREAAGDLAAESERIRLLRDRLVAGMAEAVPDAVLRGPADLGPASRLPGNAHFTFPGCEGDSLLFLLDMAGVQSSTGSACNAGVPRPSDVLLAMGVGEAEARGAQRFTLGHASTAADVERLLEVIPAAYAQARGAGMADHAPSARWA